MIPENLKSFTPHLALQQFILAWISIAWEAGSGPELKPTQQTCHLVRLLLLDGLVVQRLKENVQHQDVVPENKEAQEHKDNCSNDFHIC